MLFDQPFDECLITAIPDHELATDDGFAKPFAQVVKDNHLSARCAQLQDHVTADIAGAAGDE
jgi:hypothetical protein